MRPCQAWIPSTSRPSAARCAGWPAGEVTVTEALPTVLAPLDLVRWTLRRLMSIWAPIPPVTIGGRIDGGMALVHFDGLGIHVDEADPAHAVVALDARQLVEHPVGALGPPATPVVRGVVAVAAVVGAAARALVLQHVGGAEVGEQVAAHVDDALDGLRGRALHLDGSPAIGVGLVAALPARGVATTYLATSSQEMSKYT